jgi:hypothetical protein
LPASVPQETRNAIEYQRQHLARAIDEADGPQMLTHARALCEVVAKTVLNALGLPIPGKLAGQVDTTHAALARHPRNLEHDTELREVAGSLMKMVKAIGENRNSSGSAHGHTSVADFSQEVVWVGANAAMLWCHWAMTMLPKAETSHPSALLRDLGYDNYSKTFSSGELAERLSQLGLETLDGPGQRTLGAAVARRAARGTFTVDRDGVDTAIAEPHSFPAAYRVGALKGLLMTSDGRIRVQPHHGGSFVRLATALGDDGVAAVKELFGSLPGAPVSQAVRAGDAAGFISGLEEAIATVSEAELREAFEELLALLRERLDS